MNAKVATSQELAEALGAVWSYLNRSSSAEWFRVIEELDMSFTQVKMLFLLEDGREHSVSELAAPLRLSVPTASRAVDGLIKRGIVTRRESASDRRSRLVALSDHGHAVAARLMHARLAMLATFVNEITPDEQAALLTALSPVLERIAPP